MIKIIIFVPKNSNFFFQIQIVLRIFLFKVPKIFFILFLLHIFTPKIRTKQKIWEILFKTSITPVFFFTVLLFYILFGSPVISHEPLDRFAAKFGWRTQENHRNVGFKILSWVNRLVGGKMDQIVNWNNYEYPGKRCVLKLVKYIFSFEFR